MKKILVPCDFSEPSKEAFKFAISIASATKSEVYVLHVVELPVLHNSLLAPTQAYESLFLKDLKQKYDNNVQKMIAQWAGGVKVYSSMEHGSVSTGINRFIEKNKIDLIIMGTHGVNGVSDFVLGSNTEKTVRKSKVPVMTIKKAPQLSAIKDIIFPSDLNKIDKKPVGLIKDLQKFLKATLQVVFVNCPEHFVTTKMAEQSLTEFATVNGLTNYKLNIFNDLTEEKGIVNFSEQFENKIIAIPTHARRGLSHFFNGSITEQVIENMNWPILTFHK